VKKSPYIYPTGSGSINITAVVRSIKPRASRENKHLNGFSLHKQAFERILDVPNRVCLRSFSQGSETAHMNLEDGKKQLHIYMASSP
jgi:hypothetical protein